MRDEDVEAIIYPGNPKLVEYHVDLPSGAVAKVILPIDLTKYDVDRVTRYLNALVV